MGIITALKRIAAAFLALSVCVAVSGCDGSRAAAWNGMTVDVVTAEGDDRDTFYPYLPVKKEGGGKFKMAFIAIEPFNETFSMVYYVIENLREDGWLKYDKPPFDPDSDTDCIKLLDWLADNAESEYIEFDKDINYYTSVSSEEEIYRSLRKHIEEDKDIDIVLALGTPPAIMLEKFDFDIPLLMYNLSDPIGSGVIESADNSGDSRRWAHVDPSAYYRQMQYYYDSCKFSNIGAVYGDEIVSGMPDYRKAAEENGFTITEYKIDREMMKDDAYYEQLTQIYNKMITEDRVDAYVLSTNLIPSTDKAKELLRVFIDAKIPVFVQEGSAYVADGAALMIVEPRDAPGTAPFIERVIGAVLNGAKPGELEQKYESSPYLTLNLEVADAIAYHPTFEMLLACERLICGE